MRIIPFRAIPLLLLPAVLAPTGLRAQQGVARSSTPAPAPTRSSPVVVSARERADLVLGSWTGPLSLPGSTVTLLITISRSASGLRALLDIPGGPVQQRPLLIRQRQDSLQLAESNMSLSYPCVLSPDGSTLSGTWTQVGLRQSLVLHRGTPPASANGQKVRRKKVESKWENGEMENERPVGIWNYYTRDEVGDYVLFRTYDYDKGELTFARPDNEGYEILLPNGQWKTMILSEAPWFIGPHDFLARLTAKMGYPSVALKNQVEGTVWVSFVVDTAGHISDHQLVRGLGSGLDEQALRVIKSIPSTFTPGRDGTTAVTARRKMAIVFKL